MQRRRFLQGLAATAACLALPPTTRAWCAPLAPRPDRVLTKLGYFPTWGDVHAHCGFCDAYSLPGTSADHRDPAAIARAALANQDFFLLTPHGEQISKEEARQLAELTTDLQSNHLFDWGVEWTAAPEPHWATTLTYPLPAITVAEGHVLVLGTTEVVGHHVQGDGQPIVRGNWVELLKWLAAQPQAMAIAAHPELYEPRTSFSGFAGPFIREREAIIERFVGCELASHSIEAFPGYKGPGIASHGLAESNEAGWREFLRQGWRMAPFGSSDRHAMPYQPGPYTVAFVRSRTIEALYEAFRARRVCYSTDRRAALSLVGWWDDRIATSAIMGSKVAIDGAHLWLSAEVTGAVATSGIRFVVVTPEAKTDWELVSHSCGPGESHYGVSIPAKALDRAIAVYATADLLGGRPTEAELVSAPLFFVRTDEPEGL